MLSLWTGNEGLVRWSERKDRARDCRDCTRGVFQLEQVGVGGSLEIYSYYWKGWYRLVGVEIIANFALPFNENISMVPAEI
jgi:hypothetical protein